LGETLSCPVVETSLSGFESGCIGIINNSKF
jgi:hypothetical protein